jgi:hypothetical protein
VVAESVATGLDFPSVPVAAKVSGRERLAVGSGRASTAP